MVYCKRNLFIITMTAFIVSDMITDAVGTTTAGTSNTSANTQLVDVPVVKWNVVKSGSKNFYVQTYFVANWFRSFEFCRFHGMQMASITSNDEHLAVVNELEALGYGNDSHFWISGNDLAKEGSFVWLGNGQKFRYTNWHDGEPNDHQNEDCVEYWNKGEGFKWNDSDCDEKEFYFICEF